MILVPILLAGLAVSGFGGSTVNAGLVKTQPESVQSQAAAAAAAVSDSENNAAGVARGLELPTGDEYDLGLMIRPKRVPPPTHVDIPEMTRYSLMGDPESMDTGDLDSDRKKSVFGIRLNGPTRYESLSEVEPIRHNSPIMSDEQYAEASRRQWEQDSDAYPILRSRKGMLERQELEETANGKDEQTKQLYLRHFLLSQLLEHMQGKKIEEQAPMEPEENDPDVVTPKEVQDDAQVNPVVTDEAASQPMGNTYRRHKQLQQSSEELQLEQNHRLRQWEDPNSGSYPYYAKQHDKLRSRDPDQSMENTYPKNIESYHAQFGQPPESSDETLRSIYLISKLLQKLAGHKSNEQEGAEPDNDLDQAASGDSKQSEASGKAEQSEASGKAEQSEASDKAGQDEPVQAGEGDSQLQTRSYLFRRQQNSKDPNVRKNPYYYPDQPDIIPTGDPDYPMANTYGNLKQQSHSRRQHEPNPYYPNQPDIIPTGDPDYPMENTYRNLKQQSLSRRQHEPNPYYPNQPDIIPTGDPDYPMENTYRNLKQQSLSRRQHEPNPYYPNQPDIIPTGDADYPMENTYRNLPTGGPDQPMEKTYRGDYSGSGLLRLGHPRRPNRFKKSNPEIEDIHEAAEQHGLVSRRQASSAGEQQDESRPWEVNDLLTTKHYPIESNDVWEAQMRKRHHRPAKATVQKQNLKEVDESETTPEELDASLRNGDKKVPQQDSGSENLLRLGRPRRPNRPAENPKPQNYDVNIDLQWDQSESPVQEPVADADDNFQSLDARRVLGKKQPIEPENENEENSNSLMRLGRPKRPNRPKTKPQVNDLAMETPEDEDQHGSQLSEADDPEVLLHMRKAVQKPSDSEASNDHCSAESSDSAPKQRLDDEDELASPEWQDKAKKSPAKSGVASMKGTVEKEGIPSVSIPLITPDNCPCRRTLRDQFPSWFHVGEDRIPI